jgi:uncharacterized protein YecE (DUF72 family)
VIYIGTSGFQYDDWVGPFYPEQLAQWHWLEFYAQEFNTCELNYTFYRNPSPKQLLRMSQRVPEGFRFSMKAYKGITHEPVAEGWEEAAHLFAQAAQELAATGKLGAVLLQFPYSFRPGAEARALLERCREVMAGLPLVVEFRNRLWLRQEHLELLRRLQLGYCCVDEPRLRGLMPPEAVATAPVAYVRFHGRNAAKWWNHKEAWERYDYTYSSAELAEWVPKIRFLEAQSNEVYVYANNHWRGQAVDTARQLRALLGL